MRELFCSSKITRNIVTKPNAVSEAPPGVARNAGVEGVDGRSPASKRRSRARERKCFAIGPAPATGEGVRGTCATSPGAIRRPEVRCSLPSGQPACAYAQKLLPSGQLACSCCNDKPTVKLTCDWKAEMNLTPAEREQAFRTPHSKAAARPYEHCAHGLPRTGTEGTEAPTGPPGLSGYFGQFEPLGL